MGIAYDYNIQGIYKIISLALGDRDTRLLVFHTVEDGMDGGTYWVLARRNSGRHWSMVKQDGRSPRLHPRHRATILDEEPIGRTDAESILLLCACQEA